MKKLVCFVLTVLMLTATAVPAFAEPQKMGDSNVTWELTENKTVLIIGGEGDMPKISFPWWDAINTITTVIINYGVTSISKNAFSYCTSLTSVTIPSSVTSIGRDAFYGCTNLKSVTIPSSVTYIEENALAYCDNLSSVTVKATTPPILGNHLVFSNDNRLTIYVPFGKYNNYKYAQFWGQSSIRNRISEAYMVDVLYAENGTVTVDKDCFPTSDYTEANETVNITAVPDEGYYLKSLVWNDGTDHYFGEDEATSFTMPLNNVTVTAVFEEIETGTGSTLSEGNTVIIAVIGAVAVIGVAIVIAKKKKAEG